MKRVSINYTLCASARGRDAKGELVICNFKP